MAKPKVCVVMPAYNAARTLLRTYDEVLATGVVDASQDDTLAIARTLPHTTVHAHPSNRGYGGNQKTCYRLALEAGAEIVIMVHPDYQYTPRLIPAMVALIEQKLAHCVLGSRILGGYARKGGMPAWRYFNNRALTFAENLLTGAKLSEYHTGYRAFSAELLHRVPFGDNSDDFIFDNQMLVRILWYGYRIFEVSCPTSYTSDASSINFRRSVVYGLGCLRTGLVFRLARMGLLRSRMFSDVATDGSPNP